MRASCFDRNSPTFLAQELRGTWWANPWEKTAILHNCIATLCSRVTLFGFWRRRPACNKCLTDVDMFVYIAAREVAQCKQHRLRASPMCTCFRRMSGAPGAQTLAMHTYLRCIHFSVCRCMHIYAYLFSDCKSSKPSRARRYDIRLVHVACYDDVNVNLTEEETRGSTCPEI